MIMQKVAHKLQIIKNLAEAEKERFQEKIEVIKKQLEEIEAKSIILERKLGFFQGKKQKSGQLKGKNTLMAKKNLEQPKKKTWESLIKLIKKKYFLYKAPEVRSLQRHRNLGQQKSAEKEITYELLF